MPGGITFKWLAGILLGLVLTFGGYTFRGADQRGLANERKIAQLDVELQQATLKNAVHYQEIQRQLAELQKSIDRVERLVRRV